MLKRLLAHRTTDLLAKGFYVAAWAIVLLVLSGEVWLRGSRWLNREAVGAYTRRNVFEQGRSAFVGSAEQLWLVRGQSCRPGAKLEIDVAGQPYRVEINSHGFRDAERTRTKPAGVYRVVCLGGSTTVQGRTNETTYPALLDALLPNLPDGREVEVLNLGVSGADSTYWLNGDERLDRLFGFEPDLIVQYTFVNDFFWRYLPRHTRRQPLRRLANRSLLLARWVPVDPRSFIRDFQGTLSHFRDLADIAKSRGADYLVGSFAGPDPTRAEAPFLRYLDHNTESWGAAFGLRYYRDYHRALHAYTEVFDDFAARGRVRAVRIDRPLVDPRLYVDLCHITPERIAQLAQAFANAITPVLQASAPAQPEEQ